MLSSYLPREQATSVNIFQIYLYIGTQIQKYLNVLHDSLFFYSISKNLNGKMEMYLYLYTYNNIFSEVVL